MRCPDCSQRNSVAAKKCHTCGHKFKRKPIPLGFKITAGVVALAVLSWVGWSFIYPTLTDPEQNLQKIAKRVAKGPKSPEHAEKLLADFDGAVRVYLEDIGDQPSGELAQSLMSVLPESAFEVQVIDLPRAMRVVEVDTVLQASDYLVMKTSGGLKVFPLPGVEVFDDARVINESAGPMLVVLGHSGGQSPHEPRVRVYALLPDSITDETEKLLPAITGTGTAKFAANDRDILLELSLASLGQTENLFASLPENEDGTAKQHLEWKDANYLSRYEYGSSPFTALYAVARCMRHPELVGSHARFLGTEGKRLVKKYQSETAGNFSVTREKAGRGIKSYLVKGTDGEFQIDVQKLDGIYTVVNARETTKIAARPDTHEQETEKPEKKPATGEEVKQKEAKNPEKKEKIEPEKKTASEPEKTKPAHGTGIISREITSNAVNLRTKPSTESRPLVGIARGAKIDIVGKNKGWYKVRYQGKTGFVYGGLVDYKKPDAYTIATVTKTRDVKDSRQKIVTQAPAGEKIVILSGIHNDKYKVQLPDGKTGYVDKDAIDVAIEEPAFVP